MQFRDRRHAGRELATRLAEYRGTPSLLVLGLPRGGVPVGVEVARALEAPFDVLVVRKIGVPGHEELAMGAIASGGVYVLNDRVVRELGLEEEQIAPAIAAESAELERRERAYRAGRGPVRADGRTVILVDDGLATGASMRAAALAVRAREPERTAVAVPVAAERTCAELRADVDDVVCVLMPTSFHAVGAWYEDFTPVSDEEVQNLLAETADAGAPARR
jgi:putative phosphoribosyl transferase